jgi:hypothetical protein
LNKYHLKDFLRTPQSAIFNFRASPLKEGIGAKTLYVSPKEFNANLKIKRLEKDLANRLYYSQQHKFKPEKPKNEELKPK